MKEKRKEKTKITKLKEIGTKIWQEREAEKFRKMKRKLLSCYKYIMICINESFERQMPIAFIKP